MFPKERVRRSVKSWLAEMDDPVIKEVPATDFNTFDRDDFGSEASEMSEVSGSSRHSSKAKLRETAKLAILEAQAHAQAKRQELARQEFRMAQEMEERAFELNMEKEKVALELEREKTAAKAQYYEKIEQERGPDLAGSYLELLPDPNINSHRDASKAIPPQVRTDKGKPTCTPAPKVRQTLSRASSVSSVKSADSQDVDQFVNKLHSVLQKQNDITESLLKQTHLHLACKENSRIFWRSVGLPVVHSSI